MNYWALSAGMNTRVDHIACNKIVTIIMTESQRRVRPLMEARYYVSNHLTNQIPDEQTVLINDALL